MERFVRQSGKYIFALRSAGGVKFLFALPVLLIALGIYSVDGSGAFESADENVRPALSWKYFPSQPYETSGTLTDPESPDAQAELGDTLLRLFRQTVRNFQLHRDALRPLPSTPLLPAPHVELPQKSPAIVVTRRRIQNFAAETYLQNSLPVRAGPVA